MQLEPLPINESLVERFSNKLIMESIKDVIFGLVDYFDEICLL